MKTFKLICKGVLLYVTTFVAMLWLCGIDSIVEQGYFISWTSVMVLLIYVCYKTILKEELDILTFNKYLNKIMGDKEL